jgi:hypothetical protein
MNPYHQEQLEALAAVVNHLETLAPSERGRLNALCADYLGFRRRVEDYLRVRFGDVCSEKCYRSRLSACCSREGIITFFADVAVNALVSTAEEIRALFAALGRENTGFKCVFLGAQGCRWRIKPIVCQMFLCGPARAAVFGRDPDAAEAWKALEQERRLYTWPDRPVLFDALEALFIAAGVRSALMYLHESPGMLRIKRRAGLCGGKEPIGTRGDHS